MLKKLLQNQQNLKAGGIYSCTGIYFFKLALMGFPLLLSIYSLWVDRNGIKFSDYTSTLKYILVFNIFCLFIFVITSTLKNHWVNNAKYLLDILGDE